MAAVAGVSLTSVQRIRKAHGLAPHRMRTFKLSNDPRFAAKVRDIVGLYNDPPARALVLGIDEKSRIQALDRTRPGLPMRKGRAGTMTHDYKRHGTTTPFAAFNVLDGKVIGRCMRRHRHREFIRFLNAVGHEIASDKAIHVIPDNYATHKHPHTQTPQGGPMARPPSAVDVPLHPDVGQLAQCRRGILRHPVQTPPQARRVQRRRRSPGRHQPLPRRPQPPAKALHLESRSGDDHCPRRPPAPNVGINPLTPSS